ncbi:septal ring lytic transglycosylase RlpA family protein [Hymenobacter tibetensis]|uniref:Probable endolytic peptidoglycan transglycosylase RlpA n=1 Tax=Hymenobacter tibetensis TaxID=497967 RepID=A0ABY4D2E1_9BACT|nr:septal ring lytic transglycosylase RlpA family protein [Hymenobacter tibetensis]UOG75296.1 septal ring lytic transglycosylase RlpA family protein [Hymenobacter tibetensis]
MSLFSPQAHAMRPNSDDDKNPALAARRAAVLRGRASWYGREHQGLRTSSGERFDRNKFTCAHKTLPFGTKLRVTNLETQASVVVRVSDRGPFRHQRILDLSEIAARPLGIVEHGAVSVLAEIVPEDVPLGPSEAPADLAALAEDPTIGTEAGMHTNIRTGATEADDVALLPEPAATYVVQAGTFGDVRNAQAMIDRIQSLDPKLLVTTVAANTPEGKTLNRVVVGRFATPAEAKAICQRLAKVGVIGLVRQGENL